MNVPLAKYCYLFTLESNNFQVWYQTSIISGLYVIITDKNEGKLILKRQRKQENLMLIFITQDSFHLYKQCYCNIAWHKKSPSSFLETWKQKNIDGNKYVFLPVFQHLDMEYQFLTRPTECLKIFNSNQINSNNHSSC